MPLLLVLGAVLGPHGVGVLSERALAVVDPAIPAALAALGALLGLAIGGGEILHRRLLSGTTAEAVLVIGGGVLLAVVREPTASSALTLVLQLCGLAVVVALAGWLLLTGAASDTEQRVFTLATVLLLGGAAEYLSLSALMSGLVAGAFWHRARGPAGELIRRDLAHVQPPLIALVLVVAGAQVEVSPAIAVAAVGYAALTAGATLAGAWMRRGGASPRAPVGQAAIAPGVLGVALALTLLRVDPPAFSGVLAVAAIGAVASEFLSLVLDRGPTRVEPA